MELGLEGEVVEFFGVGVEVVEFVGLAFDEGADVFVAAFHEGDPPGDACGGEDFGIGGDGVGFGAVRLTGVGHEEGLVPVGVGLFQERREVAAVHFPRQVDASEGEEGGWDVLTAHGMLAHRALGDVAGEIDDEGGADGAVVGGDLSAEAVLAPGEALVGGEDDEGVLTLAGFFEGFEETTDAFIDGEDALIVLALPVVEGLAVDGFFCDGFLGAAALEVGLSVGTRNPFLPVAGVGGLAGAGWVDVGGDGDLSVRVGFEVAVGGSEGAVDGTIAEPEIPRLVGVSVLAVDVIECPVGVVVGGVAFDELGLATVGLDHLIVVVVAGVFRETGSVPDLLKIPVSSEPGVGAGVPLADVGGGVAVFAEDGGPKAALRGIVLAAWILTFHAHGLDAELEVTGEHGGAGGHAPGADVGMGEADAGFCQRIHVGCLDPRPCLRVAADGAVAVVIGVDEEDVGSFLRGGRGRGDARDEGSEEEAVEKSKSVRLHGRMVRRNDPGVEVISGHLDGAGMAA